MKNNTLRRTLYATKELIRLGGQEIHQVGVDLGLVRQCQRRCLDLGSRCSCIFGPIALRVALLLQELLLHLRFGFMLNLSLRLGLRRLGLPRLLAGRSGSAASGLPDCRCPLIQGKLASEEISILVLARALKLLVLIPGEVRGFGSLLRRRGEELSTGGPRLTRSSLGSPSLARRRACVAGARAVRGLGNVLDVREGVLQTGQVKS